MNMEIPVLSLITNLWEPRSRPPKAGHSPVLAGISQTVFLNQWGEPETQFGLKRLGSFYKLGPFFLIADSIEEAPHSVWIYKKRDRILFFTKKRLVSHFKWSEFKGRCTKRNEENDSRRVRKLPSLTIRTLAMVA